MQHGAAWDYIIVGAGSAGCVLAERLSADPAVAVLLIEEGGWENWLVRMPKGFAKTLAQPGRTHYVVTAHDRGVADASPETWMRGKMLGGSSGVNGMVWMRGQPEDYDRAGELGLHGWNWSDMLPCFREIERHELGDSELHGGHGPIDVTTKRPASRLSEAVIRAGAAQGMPRKTDQNQLDQTGIGYLQLNIDRRGRRVSAARGFLAAARRRPNLRIVSGLRIDRILFDGTTAIGVEGVAAGRPVRHVGRGEVIVCAGGIASPALLQRSGVGPAALLRRLAIPLVHDSPNVGRNMREHWMLQVQFRLRHTLDSLNRSFSGPRLLGNLARYALFGTGPLATGPYEVGGFFSLRPGANRADAQIMFMPNSTDETGGPGMEREPGMQMFAYKLRPESLGVIELTAADPLAPLHVDPRYLSTPADRADSIAMIRRLRALAATPPLRDLIVGETPRTSWAQTDEQILAAFQRHGQAGYHACSTCAMGADATAVLDDQLRVRGVERLRVVDLSAFPDMISGNTNAPVMAFAWRAAELIRDQSGSMSPSSVSSPIALSSSRQAAAASAPAGNPA